VSRKMWVHVGHYDQVDRDRWHGWHIVTHKLRRPLLFLVHACKHLFLYKYRGDTQMIDHVS
jgi:hypothetical protein